MSRVQALSPRPGIGLADDARLLERILERNQLKLRRYLGKPSALADAQNR
jgi:hypothetical protein